jgi:hypothetical protein
LAQKIHDLKTAHQKAVDSTACSASGMSSAKRRIDLFLSNEKSQYLGGKVLLAKSK